MLEISRFKPGDLSELQKLIHTTIKKCYPVVYAPEIIDFFLNYHSKEEILTRSEKAVIMLLRIDNKMIATGFLHENEIGGVYVLPEYQGLGYGRKIVESLLEIAKENELEDIHLDSTPIARAMYEKLGFHITENAVQMVGHVPLPYFKMKLKLK